MIIERDKKMLVKNLILFLVLTVFFTVFSIVDLAELSDDGITHLAETPLYRWLCGILAVILASCAVVTLISCFSKKPFIEVTPEYFSQHISRAICKRVEMADIVAIYVKKQHIVIELKDPEKYQKKSGFFVRITASLDKKLGYGDFTVPWGYFSGKRKALIDYVNARIIERENAEK